MFNADNEYWNTTIYLRCSQYLTSRRNLGLSGMNTSPTSAASAGKRHTRMNNLQLCIWNCVPMAKPQPVKKTPSNEHVNVSKNFFSCFNYQITELLHFFSWVVYIWVIKSQLQAANCEAVWDSFSVLLVSVCLVVLLWMINSEYNWWDNFSLWAILFRTKMSYSINVTTLCRLRVKKKNTKMFLFIRKQGEEPSSAQLHTC